jgi:hypothetical protein
MLPADREEQQVKRLRPSQPGVVAFREVPVRKLGQLG